MSHVIGSLLYMEGQHDVLRRLRGDVRPVFVRMRSHIIRRAQARKRRQDAEPWIDLGGECG